MRVYKKLFNKILDPENLFLAWDEFKSGKRNKLDVLQFEKNLEQNIFQLYRDLKNKIYKHGGYTDFYISDPKRRHIHKATVRDRVLHHAIFYVLNHIFEPIFINDSYSCRVGKGTHKGVLALDTMLRRVSRNYTHPCYALKCDIKRFFDSIDHEILLRVLGNKIMDENAMWLLREIVKSYSLTDTRERERERE